MPKKSKRSQKRRSASSSTGFWRRNRAPMLACGIYALLHTLAFHPFNLSEAAYLFALPVLLWLPKARSAKAAFGWSVLFGALSWLVLIIWLRHVTAIGTVLLAAAVAAFPATWFAVAHWMLPRAETLSAVQRLLSLLALAALWPVLEWVRGHLFTGFPWLPLAASQWNRPVLLQILAYTGYYGLSFVLIFFNLGLYTFIRRLTGGDSLALRARRPSPELFAALGLLMLTFAFAPLTGMFRQEREHVLTAAAVQPNIAGELKWDTEREQENLNILITETRKAALEDPDIILWPEAATPWPILGPEEYRMREDIEAFVRQLGIPILMGNTRLKERPKHNLICLVTPEGGMLEPYYAKRHLVLFGEYSPIPGLDALVGIGSFDAGEEAVVFNLGFGKDLKVGPLVCYEDAFATESSETVAKGADFVFVATNSSWYGEEWQPLQHAVHAALRAAETKRPFVRCGNGGWSGWFDEFGAVKEALLKDGNVYFQGYGLMNLSLDKHWRGKETVYVRWGDWFPALCALAFAGSVAALRRQPTTQPTERNP